MNVEIRPAVPSDAEACGRISYEAFKGIRERHGFPPHFPTVEVAIQRATFCISHPSIFGVVAESDGQIIGSNFLDERDPIRGLGPITVDPKVQVRGVGRRLIDAVLERARGAVGVRLVQDTFNMLSVSLYASFGLSECAALCRKVHEFDRLNELRDALKALSPLVAVREGRITAYALALHRSSLNHAVADTEEDMKALLLAAGATNSEPLAFLLPVRQASFFRYCLSEGFRAVLPMTLMAMGKYQEPDGCYIPSILY